MWVYIYQCVVCLLMLVHGDIYYILYKYYQNMFYSDYTKIYCVVILQNKYGNITLY